MDKKLIVAIIITTLYALITLVGVLHHEIWADEAQTWMLCNHLSFPQLINHLHNEGHPAFFYSLIMPFAKISGNILWQQLVCWIAMCIAVFLLLYKSNFPTIVKLAIMTSGGFLYFFPIINRSYSIIPFLIFWAAILYSTRKEKPILYSISLFLIVNTHAIMLGFVSILAIIYTYETIKEKTPFRSKNYLAIAIMFIGVLLLLFQLHDTTSSNYVLNFKIESFLINLVEIPLLFFVNAYSELLLTGKSITLHLKDIIAIFSIIITFILLVINLFKNNKKLFLTFICGLGFQFAIYVLVYANKYSTRVFTGLLILIFCFWILYKENSFNEKYKICTKKATTFLLTIFFILTSFNGIQLYILDLQHNYAGAKETAYFIKNNINNKDSILLVDNEPFSIALAYYLKDDYQLYSVLRAKYLKYVIWDNINANRFSINSWVDFCNLIENKYKDIYIVRSYYEESKKIKGLLIEGSKHQDKFKLLFSSTPAIINAEGYRVYKYEK